LIILSRYLGRKLDGVIYVHRLADQRIGGVSLRNFDLLKELCGQKTLKNVVILTHMEDEVSAREYRVTRLQKSDLFYKLALDDGAQFVPHDGSLQSARAILRRIIDPSSQSIGEEDEQPEEDDKHPQSSSGPILAIPQPLSGARISSFTFSVDGDLFACGFSDNTVIAGHVGTDERKSRKASDAIHSLAFTPDGLTLVFGCGSGIGVWRYRADDSHFIDIVSKHPVTSVAFSPDGRQLASSSRSKVTMRGTIPTVNEQGHISVHRDVTVHSLAFSPDSQLIASGSNDKAVRVWNAFSRERVLGPLRGHSGTIRSVIFSPKGSHIVSGSDDTTIRVWDAKSGSPLFTLQGHTDRILSIAFSRDDELKMASSSKDGTVLVWDIKSGERVLGPLRTADGTSLWSVVFPRHREGVIAAAVSGGATTIHSWHTKLR
jgi:WD40 repeat protein